jgi:hypothetical protein
VRAVLLFYRKEIEYKMILKTTPTQAMQVRRLAHRLCANYDHGNCLLLDDGEKHTCVQLLSLYGIYCKYFKDGVLPEDKELYEQIIKQNCKSQI